MTRGIVKGTLLCWPLSLLLQSQACFAAPALVCPATIPQQSIRITDPPQGWSVFAGAPLYLHSAAPMSGPPEDLGELSDFRQKRLKDGWIDTYPLDGKFPKGKWLACRYGVSDQVTLAKRLEDSVLQCTFTYRQGAYAGQNDIAISCK